MTKEELQKAIAALDDEGKQEILKALGVEEPDPVEVLKGLPEEKRAEIAKLLVGEPKPVTADDIIKAIEGLKPKDDADKVPDEVAKAIKAQEERVKKAEDRAEKAEQRVDEMEKAQRRDGYIAEAKSFSDLPGVNPDDFAGILEKADAGLDDEGRKKLREVLKGSNEALKDSALLKELGSGELSQGDADAEIDGLATEIMKSDTELTKEQARAKVMDARPDLAKRALEEDRARIREREDRR